jgi:mitotic spindle assembly checkpoint protein MAD2B
LTQGNVEKVVVVIKDKDEVALERFIFSIQTMIAVESFNKDTRLELSSLLAHVTMYVFLS